MRRSARSIYRLHDVMIAVAFTAVGIKWVQTEWQALPGLAGRVVGWTHNNRYGIGLSPIYLSTRAVVATALYVATGVASPWAVFLLYRSRRQGRTWRFGRVRRPGAVASLAASVVLIFELFHSTLDPGRATDQVNVWYQADLQEAQVRLIHIPAGHFVEGIRDPFFDILFGMPRSAGLLVAGAWLTMILAGAWRPEPTWVDRSGRALGVFWIVAAAHFYLFPL